jgi:hypothetical protein
MPRPIANQVNDAVTVPRAAAVYLGAVALALALPVLLDQRASLNAENMPARVAA